MTTFFVKPNWPAPSHVKAYTTLRTGMGISEGLYAQFNLGDHVGDDEKHVQTNRALLKEKLHLPAEPIWLTQTHSTRVVEAHPNYAKQEADASFTKERHHVSIIMTADCLPILLCDKKGTAVAALHGGWRGLHKGIIESTLAAMKTTPDDMLAWLGPAISVKHYEVGEEVREAFIQKNPLMAQTFIPSSSPMKWQADLYAIARLQLQACGVTAIFGGDYCTYSDTRFFSYRRDGEKSGRIATLIWID